MNMDEVAKHLRDVSRDEAIKVEENRLRMQVARADNPVVIGMWGEMHRAYKNRHLSVSFAHAALLLPSVRDNPEVQALLSEMLEGEGRG